MWTHCCTGIFSIPSRVSLLNTQNWPSSCGSTELRSKPSGTSAGICVPGGSGTDTPESSLAAEERSGISFRLTSSSSRSKQLHCLNIFHVL